MSTLDYFSLSHPFAKLRSNASLKARTIMFDIFMEELRPGKSAKILDVGATPDNSLPDSNFFLKLYPYKKNITSVSIEDLTPLKPLYPEVAFQTTNGKTLPFDDKSFDIVFSSAVIEHVGSRANQRQFLEELSRVGKRIFVTTPNRWHPMEFHTILPLIHWLPQAVHQRILRSIGHEFLSKTENLNLLGKRDFSEIAPTSLNNTFKFIKFLGFNSNLVFISDNNV